jgi:hypothetical protein
MTEAMSRTPTLLRTVLLIHGAITLAGAVLMMAYPKAIPAAVGIDLRPDDYLLVYLVAAAELAAAVLSFGAVRLADRSALLLVVATFVVLHGASGLLNVLYASQIGWRTVLVVNTGARFAAVAVLLFAWRSGTRGRTHQTWGTNR